MKVVRKKLTADEFSPANKRYVIEDDMVQTSPDGGVTWYDDPASDPRYNPLNLLPVRGGADPQCDAAENMMQHFKAMVDAFLSSSGILQLVNLFVGLLLFIPGVNVIVALLFAIADALFVLGTEVVDAAMTDPVYDQIKCILYANIDADGRMSAAQLVDVYADVDAQIGGVAATVFHEVTRAWGEVGFSNAGATGEYEGDCDECASGWCISWATADGEASGIEVFSATFTEDGYRGDPYPPATSRIQAYPVTAYDETTMQTFDATYSVLAGAGAAGYWQLRIYSGASLIYDSGHVDLITAEDQHATWSGSEAATSFVLDFYTGSGGVTIYLQGLEMTGEGEAPDILAPCEGG